MTRIIWHNAMSNHTKLRLTPKILRLAKLRPFQITCCDPDTGTSYQFYKEGDTIRQEDPPLCLSGSLHLPTEGKTCIIEIRTMYRDMSNYKTHDTHRFCGNLVEADLDTLLTAFFMDPDGIIPHQITMRDHQDPPDGP